MNAGFDDIVLHPETTKALTRYLSHPVHAVLLEGSHGLGKTLIASHLAAKLLDVEPDKLATYPYVRTLLPEKQAIPIEQVRGLHDFFARKVPGQKRIKRVVVVPDANLMTIPAQNALLKLLEEPPEDTVFILTSSAARKLLPTIISRTQSIAIHTPSDKAIVEHFENTYDAAAVHRAQLIAGHDIARIAALLTDTGTENSDLDLVKQVLSGSSYDKLLLLGKIAQDKEKTLSFVDTLGEIVSVSLQASAAKGGTSTERWQRAQHAAYTASAALRRNASPKLVMTELALAL